MSADSDTKIVGYFAYSANGEALCDGEACIIAGSDIDLKTYLSQTVVEDGGHYTLKKTRFGEIMRGMRREVLMRLMKPLTIDSIHWPNAKASN